MSPTVTTLLVGLGPRVISLWGLGYSLALGMEDLTQSWKKMSLTDVEETNIDLSSDK